MGSAGQALPCCLVTVAPSTPVVTVVRMDDEVPLDRFADWLDGVRVRLVRADLGEDPGPASELDGLIVLGGRMSAHDDQLPQVPAARALLADAVAAGVPTLGICLGAQLLAVATGGRVHVDAPPGREAGAVALHWRPEATGDPVLGELAGDRGVLMPTMHSDAVVDLPRAGVWLAASPMYPYQAFRIGSAWGVQFHPEASPELMRRWAELDQLPADEAEAMVEQATAADDRVARDGRTLARAFAAQVRAAA
ncbi:type 1 glutamine amidotransferase [Cellulomonas denverensis]|uniref:Type 1 glutamine amidotransferase n=2 Tax=Cellulomonas denverensis TaxID=264297 RepID=A0A7X6KVH9_9CELL|nr:type 1 glutamine amidotransferase [Cellulomonas denverensis]